MNIGAGARLIAVLGVIGALAPASLRAFPPASQETALTGRVVEQASGAAIAGASVIWMPPGDAGARREPVSSNSFGGFPLPESWGRGGTIEGMAPGYLARTLTWEEAAAADWRLELARDPLALDEVVVTASVRARRRSEIALPVESIEATEIAAAGAASADRLLEELPGVQVTGNAPTGSNLLIRGIGGARVLVLLDGQPVTGTLIENRDLSRMSLAGSDRVEIVKGPLSSLYGSDALGGVVNVITRLPASGFRLDARALSGGAGRQEAEATASGGGRLQYSITGAWRQEDQVPGLVSGGEDAFARVWDGRSRFRFAVTDDWELRAGLTYLRERQRWPVGGGFSGFNDNRGFSGWLETRRRYGSGEWSANVFAQDYEHLYRSARGDAPIAGDRSNAQWERLARVTAGYSGTRGEHDFDMGIEGAARAIESPDKLVEERAEDDQIALFAQDAWRLGATVVSAGARLTGNSRWGSDLAPSFGLARRFGDGLRLRAALAQGFRAPSFKELGWSYANLAAGYMIQGYADLEPERSWSVSGGVEWQPGARLLLEAEAYSNRVENLIEPGFVGHAPSGLLIYSPRNVANAVTQGIELGLRALWDDVEFAAGYAWLDAHEADSGLPLDRRASHSARARVTWIPADLSGVRMDGTVHFTGSAPIVVTGPDRAELPSAIQARFTAVDLQATLPIADNLELLAGVDNLFDARPAGWQGIIERRFRMSVRLRELFAG
ncbi:MAG: TonB-dependent receptor [Gammaproteobacteria bacterium]|nr:TonB-dependent receptor [Gammaproteobacteria bacterium]